MRYSRKIYGLLLLIFALGLATAATTPVVAQKQVPTYTYEVRSNAKYKDGTTLTAEDVKWTYERMMLEQWDAQAILASNIYSIEAVDATHVKFTLNEPFPFFEDTLTSEVGCVIKKDSVPWDEALDDREDGTIAWGTGPYRMTSDIRDSETVLERNPDHWGPPAKNKKVIIKYYPSEAQLALALEGGDIDLAFRHLDPTKMVELAANEDDDIETIMPASTQVRYIVLPNETLHSRITLGIRQAISYAVDRDAILEGVSPLWTSAYTMVPPGFLGRYEMFPKRDLAKARELLKAEGYSEANKFELELWWSPTHYGTTEAAVAIILKAALEETGIMKVEIPSAEWSTYLDKMDAIEMETFLLGWYPDYQDPDTYLYSFYHSVGANWGPLPDPGNPELDALLVAARLETSTSVRELLYEEATAIMAEEAKVIPLWYGEQYCAFKDYVKDVVLGPDTSIRFWKIQKGDTTDGELKVGTIDHIDTLDHMDAYDYWSWRMADHCLDKLVDYKEGTSEKEYLLATGPPTIGSAIIGIEPVTTTVPITQIVTTTVSEFGTSLLVVGGSLILSIVLRAYKRKRN